MTLIKVISIMKQFMRASAHHYAKYTNIDQRTALINDLLALKDKYVAEGNIPKLHEVEAILHTMQKHDNEKFWIALALAIPAGYACSFLNVHIVVKILIAGLAGFALSTHVEKFHNAKTNASIRSKLASL